MIADELRALAAAATANRAGIAKTWAEKTVSEMSAKLYDVARDGRKEMTYDAVAPFGFAVKDVRLLNEALFDLAKTTGLKMSVSMNTLLDVPLANVDTHPLKRVTIVVTW